MYEVTKSKMGKLSCLNAVSLFVIERLIMMILSKRLLKGPNMVTWLRGVPRRESPSRALTTTGYYVPKCVSFPHPAYFATLITYAI